MESFAFPDKSSFFVTLYLTNIWQKRNLCKRALKLHFLYSANHPKKQTLDCAQRKLGAQIEKKLRILTLSHIMHGVPTLPSLNMPFGHAKISNTQSQTQYLKSHGL